MAKARTVFVCQECGHEAARWLGRCPACSAWNTMVQEMTESGPAPTQARRSITGAGKPVRLVDSKALPEPRTATGLGEFDRVLGGGVVGGSLVLVGGDPGIGKSTILLQVADRLAKVAGPALYVSGEESVEQVRLRAARLGTVAPDLMLYTETDLHLIERAITETNPAVAIVDSIQTIFHPDLPAAPGTVTQVRESAAVLMRLAKTTGVPVFLVGHVTKSGEIAGPRVLEHMVDTVLYFEGERHTNFRVLRAVKNRFGSTHEIGVFEMHEDGLAEVANPSALFLAERPAGAPGSVVVPTLEGTRPLLVEVQALVGTANFMGTPRRLATGVDHNRLAIILAVLDKRAGLATGTQDVYANVAGGVRVEEPAADLGIALAVASSLRNVAVDPQLVVLGEVGLAGEVRAVTRVEHRLAEAAKLGFQQALVPKANLRGLTPPAGFKVVGVTSVSEALDLGAVR